MVSQTAEYAIHAVLYLAHTTGEPAVAQVIAQATGVPKGYLHKILRRLGKAGILGSQRGVGGGYILLNPANQVSILEIIRAAELSRSKTHATGSPHGQDPVHRLIERAAQRADDVFGSTTLQDLIESGETPSVRASA